MLNYKLYQLRSFRRIYEIVVALFRDISTRRLLRYILCIPTFKIERKRELRKDGESKIERRECEPLRPREALSRERTPRASAFNKISPHH